MRVVLVVGISVPTLDPDDLILCVIEWTIGIKHSSTHIINEQLHGQYQHDCTHRTLHHLEIPT